MKDCELKKRGEDLVRVKDELEKSKKEINTITSNVTYCFYVVTRHQYQVEIKLDFVDNEPITDSISAHCQKKWSEEEAKEEDIDPSHYEHLSHEKKETFDIDQGNLQYKEKDQLANKVKSLSQIDLDI